VSRDRDDGPASDADPRDGGHVRPARPADAPALRRLQSHLREPSPDLLAAAVDALDGPLPSPFDCRVVVAGGGGREDEDWDGDGGETAGSDALASTPVGYLLAVAGEPTHVAELVVAPAHRRAGHGRALLASLVADRPAGTRVTLTVAPGNDAARALYGTLGFAVVDEEPDAFDDGPGLVLSLTVGDAGPSG
jgi:ribosomal-protein-alanine N-acetyltransferase